MLHYDVAQRGDLTLYEFVYRSIRDDIVSGTLDPGDRLPSKRAFAQRLGVSLVTVESAYGQLVAEGYCTARPRSGYYVNALPGKVSFSRHRHVAHERQAETRVLYDFSKPTADVAMVSRVWGKAMRGTLASEPDEELYGPQPAKGTHRLRQAISERLRQTRGIDADPECIVVGAGAQILDVALAQLLRPSGAIALEDPGYPRLQRIYSSLGLAVCPVALDGEGIDMAQLRSSRARIAHVMPSHQFPTGIVTSIARRYELLGWASEHEDAYLIEDDYDATFRMSGRPIASLASIDVEGRVIYTNTFSKSLGPAIRAAFMVLPEALADRWDAAAGFYSNTVSAVDQVALARMLESGDYERHVNRYRKAQREVRDALIDELRQQGVGARMHVEQEDSGLHFVLVVEDADESELAARALAGGVRLAPLSTYSLSGGGKTGEARFAMQYGGIDVAGAREAARIVAQLL